MALGPTPSQTVGPFFHLGLVDPGGPTPLGTGMVGRLVIRGSVCDGATDPVDDALVEIWHAGPDGRFPAPSELGGGFGRAATGGEGTFEFTIVKPGPFPDATGRIQAPHVNVSIFARGLLKRLVTRIYFPDEAAANRIDPVLASIGDPEARSTLIAEPDGEAIRFDIHLQGSLETVFFAL